MPVHRPGLHYLRRFPVVPDAGHGGLCHLPGEPGDETGVPDGPVTVPAVRGELDLHRYVAGVSFVCRFDHQAGVPEAASHVPGQGVSRHLAQVCGVEGPDELQARVGRDAQGVLDGPSPGEVSLDGAGVALYAVQSRIYVDVRCPVFFDEGVELDRELQQVFAQYLGPDGVPSLGVVPERLEEIVLAVDGRHDADYTPFIGLAGRSLPFHQPRPSAWHSCACGTAGGPRRTWGSGSGRVHLVRRNSGAWWSCVSRG